MEEEDSIFEKEKIPLSSKIVAWIIVIIAVLFIARLPGEEQLYIETTQNCSSEQSKRCVTKWLYCKEGTMDINRDGKDWNKIKELINQAHQKCFDEYKISCASCGEPELRAFSLWEVFKIKVIKE